MPGPIRLVHNSQLSQSGSAGYGWIVNASNTLTTNQNGSITLLKQTGQQRTYYPNSTGGYTTPAGEVNTLLRNSDGTFTETQPNGKKYSYGALLHKRIKRAIGLPEIFGDATVCGQWPRLSRQGEDAKPATVLFLVCEN